MVASQSILAASHVRWRPHASCCYPHGSRLFLLKKPGRRRIPAQVACVLLIDRKEHANLGAKTSAREASEPRGAPSGRIAAKMIDSRRIISAMGGWPIQFRPADSLDV